MESAFERGNRVLDAGNTADAIEAFSECLTNDPTDWQAAGNRAMARMKDGQHALALDDYLLALSIKPDANGIKINLSVLLKELGELALAETMLREVLTAEPEQADAWSNLGLVSHYQLRYEEAADYHLKAIELGGPSVARLNNLANTLTCALHLEASVDAYQAALQLAPLDPCVRFNLSIALLLQGRYAEAWPLYEDRWESVFTRRHSERPWPGDALNERTLLVWSEQGLGDTLQMVRFLPELQRRHPAARIVLACPPSCHRLFRQLDGITLVDVEAPPPHYDVQLPLLSLPGKLGIDLDGIKGAPYLVTDAAWRETWRTQLGEKPAGTTRIGVVWETGVWGVGISDHGRQNKSIPAELFRPLTTLPGIEVYSLQLSAVPEVLQDTVTSLPIGDFADTAAIVQQLDLIISVDTSVVHLTGALGVPTWVLMRAESAPFFMAGGDTMPWYDSVRVWRQPRPGDWTPVIAGVAAALAALASA